MVVQGGMTALWSSLTGNAYIFTEISVTVWNGYQEDGLLGAVNAINPVHGIVREGIASYDHAANGD